MGIVLIFGLKKQGSGYKISAASKASFLKVIDNLLKPFYKLPFLG